MSVLPIMEDVIKLVLMRLAHFIVNVIQDILLMVMVVAAPVRYKHTNTYCYCMAYNPIIVFGDGFYTYMVLSII